MGRNCGGEVRGRCSSPLSTPGYATGKYWRELNLVVGSQPAIANVLAGVKFVGSVWDHHM